MTSLNNEFPLVVREIKDLQMLINQADLTSNAVTTRQEMSVIFKDNQDNNDAIDK